MSRTGRRARFGAMSIFRCGDDCIASISADPVALPLRRRNSSAAITTTSSRPCTVTCCGPSLRTFRTSSLKRALASCKSQYPDRGLGPRVFGIFGAAGFDFTILVMLTRIHQTSRLFKTQRERLCKKLKALNVRLAELRVNGGKAMLEYVVRHLQGHIQYYGVSGNFRSVQRYRHYARRLLFKWLNRRSQRRSVTWARFHTGVGPHLPRARIVHNLYPTPPWKAQAGSRMV